MWAAQVAVDILSVLEQVIPKFLAYSGQQMRNKGNFMLGDDSSYSYREANAPLDADSRLDLGNE